MNEEEEETSLSVCPTVDYSSTLPTSEDKSEPVEDETKGSSFVHEEDENGLTLSKAPNGDDDMDSLDESVESTDSFTITDDSPTSSSVSSISASSRSEYSGFSSDSFTPSDSGDSAGLNKCEQAKEQEQHNKQIEVIGDSSSPGKPTVEVIEQPCDLAVSDERKDTPTTPCVSVSDERRDTPSSIASDGLSESEEENDDLDGSAINVDCLSTSDNSPEVESVSSSPRQDLCDGLLHTGTNSLSLSKCPNECSSSWSDDCDNEQEQEPKKQEEPEVRPEVDAAILGSSIEIPNNPNNGLGFSNCDDYIVRKGSSRAVNEFLSEHESHSNESKTNTPSSSSYTPSSSLSSTDSSSSSSTSSSGFFSPTGRTTFFSGSDFHNHSGSDVFSDISSGSDSGSTDDTTFEPVSPKSNIQSHKQPNSEGFGDKPDPKQTASEGGDAERRISELEQSNKELENRIAEQEKALRDTEERLNKVEERLNEKNDVIEKMQALLNQLASQSQERDARIALLENKLKEQSDKDDAIEKMKGLVNQIVSQSQERDAKIAELENKLKEQSEHPKRSRSLPRQSEASPPSAAATDVSPTRAPANRDSSSVVPCFTLDDFNNGSIPSNTDPLKLVDEAFEELIGVTRSQYKKEPWKIYGRRVSFNEKNEQKRNNRDFRKMR